MPANTVYVGRPSKWGNPFVGPGAAQAYRNWLTTGWRTRVGVVAMPDGSDASVECIKLDTPKAAELRAMLPELRGKNLACWCRLDAACHATVLLELANQ